MGFYLIKNTVLDQAALVDTLPLSSADVSAVTGGPLYLTYSSSSNPLEIDYIDKNGDLSSNVFVGSNFNTLSGLGVQLHYYSSFSGSEITISAYPSFSEPLHNESYFILPFSTVSGAEAFGITVSGAGKKQIGKLFFSTATEFFYSDSKVDYQPLDNFQSVQLDDGTVYSYDALIRLTLNNLTKEELDGIEALRLNKGTFFLYDSTGDFLINNLEYCCCPFLPVEQFFDDIYTLELTLYRVSE